LFRSLDGGNITVPVETRHPFLDLRVLRYMVSVPAIPWCRAKYLERRAMRGELPDAVLKRPKSPLTSDPAWEGFLRLPLPQLSPTVAASDYVDTTKVPKSAETDMVAFRLNFRPFALQYWLQNQQPREITYK